MNNMEILNDKSIYEWDKFVKSHPLGTVYHTSDWQQLIRRTYGYKPCYLIIRDNSGNIKAGMPLFQIGKRDTDSHMSSLPGAQFCNPLLSDADDLENFISHVLGLIRYVRIKYFELKLSATFPIQKKGNWPVIDDYSTYILDINRPLDKIYSTFHKSCIQRPIKKLSKFGLRMIKGNSENDVNIFYDLHLHMRRKYGLIPLPYKFFLFMWQIMSKRQLIDILHAEHKGKIISSIILLKFKDTVIYEYGASDTSMFHLHPSHFLLWEAIKNAKAEGYNLFDFGRTSSENKGLSEFKLRWGTKQMALSYYYIPDIKGSALIRRNKYLDKLMYHTVRYMPLSLLKFLGDIIFRRLA